MSSSTVQDTVQDSMDPISAILLAEHERLASLYEHNVTMGDHFVATHLTAVSLAVALLIGVRELVPQSDSLILFELTMLIIVVAVGMTTYRRLVERRVRSVEYLRAINRIHRYFVDKDPTVQPYFYWPACDDCPPVGVRGTLLGGLRDIVAGLNGLFTGLAFLAITRTLFPALPSGALILTGLVAGVMIWFIQHRFGENALQRAAQETDRKILFPQLR